MAKRTVGFADLSLGFRHWCVKLLAPTLWQTMGELTGEDSVEVKRSMVSFLKDHFGSEPLVGCEIGTREGINAARILRTLNIKKLYLIDPYMAHYTPSYPITSSQEYQDKMWAQAHEFLKSYGDKIVWLRDTSDNAVKDIAELDFCYIDGDHSYGQVKRDIENYSPLIRKGGVLGGHDFTTTHMGVCRAVIEYRNQALCELQGAGCDWWMVKA
jgi:hypothetical protein